MTPSLLTLDTPAALIDETRMTRNIQLMQARMDALGVRLRPHVKTSKSEAVMRRQLDAGAEGVTVSTLQEAEACFALGITDVLYAVAIAPARLEQVRALRRRGCRLGILTDSLAGARAIVEAGQRHAEAFDVWLEIDCDGHRAGLQPDDPKLLQVAEVLRAGGMTLVGVLTHAGSSYELHETAALQALAEQERALCVAAAERLRGQGFACPQVSIGSTPTALSARDLTGVTEVRAGVYVFQDLVMLNVGICRADDLALSVLTTVIGHQPEKGGVLVDAGWMALSRDRGTQRQQRDFGYGQVCDLDGTWLEGALLSGANQEHGMISFAGGAPADLEQRFPVGSRLRVLPNHACATGGQFDHYHAVDATGALTAWSRLHGR
ncbi:MULTISPECIES: alanine racemase [Pseudomonas]|uniref:Alanine racemase n=1 Tax=Pseudomonas oryzihabitans TaxID=47885 RepID=A0A2Z5A8X0_9PSED|nr:MULTISPECIES: alanine racemase [Pseudomonas]AXA66934.1 alanine racemase [Pseudomonas oryzihabitans]